MNEKCRDEWLSLEEALAQSRQSDDYPELREPGDYVDFDEAVRWIAHGTFGEPSLGPRSLAYFVFEWGNDDGAYTLFGRESLARELLIDKLVKSNSAVWGFLSGGEPGSGDLGPSSGDAYSRIVRIPARLLVELESEAEGEAYYLDERGFDCVLVEAAFLFSQFRNYDSQSETTGRQAPPYNVADDSRRVSEDPVPVVRGRPPKWDWDWLMTEIIALANDPDGLPDKQADLESWAAELFLEKYGAEPAVSLIRKKLGPIYRRLRSKC